SSAVRDAADLFFYREFLHSSPIPQASNGLLQKLGTPMVTLPPKAYLGDGTQSVEGLCFLVLLAKVLNAHRVFEIGTFTGVTALTLAMNLPTLTIDTLDLPTGNLPVLSFAHDDKGYIPAQQRHWVFEDKPEAVRITQHEGDSAQFDFSAMGKTFDLVYVDGAHSYDYVANDTKAAFSLVRDAVTAIVWDDYSPGWRGVVRYLNERTDLELYRVPDTRLVLWLSREAKSLLTGD
ncbi:MAG: class I SAM-dependent methyltransferase, partial [Acidobacteriaceae bacterium]